LTKYNTMAQQTPAKRLFDLLVTRNFDPETLDSSGKPAADPADAEIFSFDFRADSGKDYGTVVIMLGDDNRLDVFGADNVGKTMEGSDKNDWFAFLQQLKIFAVKNFMSFSTRDLNRLRYSMQGQAAITEGLFESWSGRKDVSWNAGATESRLVIKHKRSLGEGEARFRYVESLFVETADGERYKLPFKNLTAGKAMLEHVRMGGRPYDLRGQHISEMVNQLSLLGRFRRANQGRLLEGDTAQLVEQTNAYYENLKQSLKHLCSRTGYAKYFESWTPTEITEQEVVIEGLKHLFVTQSIDQRIEDALPIIARIQQQENSMKEANIFEAWANRLMEGVWQLPDTPEKQAQLVELMSAELPVGADAINAKEQLYDLIGDDVLFDQLMDLADRDANADARQVIINRMQEMSDYPDIAEVMTQFTVDTDTPAEPAEPMSEIKDPADQTEDPADTQQPEYPEYQDNLADILKNAGVDDTVVRAAPDYEAEVDETANPGVTPEDIDGTAEETLSEFAPLAAAVGGALARGAVGAGAGALQRGAASIAGQVAGNAIGNMLGGEEVDEGRCNMSEAGTSCPVHGMMECAMEGQDTSPLAGQYGHSGKMKEVGKDSSFLDRLKELSGMMRK
jgi:hypothetical protein